MKVEKLTPEQESKFAEIVAEFKALGTSTSQEHSTVEIKEAFDLLYTCAKLPPPKEIVLVDSPVAVQLEFHKRAGTKDTLTCETMGYGSQDAGWLAFYEYFRRYVPEVKLDADISGLVSLLGKVSFYIATEEVVFASKNPTELHFLNDRLHNASGPSWKYADGFCGYSLFGTAVTEGIVSAVRSGDANSILAITNAEQRLVAMKAAGPELMLAALGGKVISEMGDGEYTLFEVTIEGEKHRLLKMRNPSEPKDHYEFVPPEVQTVAKALAWRIGWEEYSSPLAKT